MVKAKSMLEKLLKQKSTTGRQTIFKDGVEETQTGDLGLYVPIVKILMKSPDENELNTHISSLVVTVILPFLRKDSSSGRAPSMTE